MTDTEPLVVASVLTPQDWAALQAAWARRAQRRVGRWRMVGAVGLPLVAAGAVLAALDGRGVPVAFGVGALAVLASVASSSRMMRRASAPSSDGLVLGRVRMELSTEGLRTERAHATGMVRWSTLQEVTRTSTHLFLWVDAISGYILPLRDLPEGVGADAALERIRALAGRATVVTTEPAPARGAGAEGEAMSAGAGRETSDAAGRGPRPLFRALVRRLTWRAAEDGGGSSDGVTAASALLALVIWLSVDRYVAGPRAVWFAGGVGGLAWYACGLLALAWVLHRSSGRTAPFGSLLSAIVGALPLALVLGLAVRHRVPACLHSLAYALLAAAALAVVFRALRAASGEWRPGTLLAGVVTAALFAWGTSAAWVYPHLWFANENEEEPGQSWADAERLLFQQADRIDAAAARVARGRPGRPDVFFLGFAGVGEQKVFAEEVALAERVVAARYHASGRSLLLVNDARDRESRPLATVPGLERALRRMGERMDREDVLFLALSSHGSPGGELAVSNGTWPLSPIDGRGLRAALDASGIRWRVVVVSGCHSGAFVEPLAGEGTIVLASAAADRASFGCSDDRELTDFGAAFFRDALPSADSLASAFAQAKSAVAGQERERKVQPSLPPSSFGAAIEAYWREVEADARSER